MIKRAGKRGALYLGIEIGGTKLQIFVGESDGQVVERNRFVVDKKATAKGIHQKLAQVIPGLVRRHKPAGIGVGFGGPVNSQTGQISRSHQIEGWSGFSIARWLQNVSGVPVRVDNDANTGALGEALHGAGRGCKIIFYVTLGSGVGGGLVVNGTIYHGATPGESEIGHVRMDKTGVTLEQRCSGWAVDARLRAAARKNPRGALAKCLRGVTANEAKVFPAALARKDLDARRILKETADDLAFGLSHVTHLFHPEVIVLGGGLALAGEPLRAAVEDALGQYVMEVFAPGPAIVLSKLREDAVPVGALSLAHQRIGLLADVFAPDPKRS